MHNVIHINETLSVAGGVEVYISQLCKLLPALGWVSEWISIKKEGDIVYIRSTNVQLEWTGKLAHLPQAPLFKKVEELGGLLHVHSLSEPSVLNELFKIAPVIRTAHEPRLICPGHGKFLTNSETVCDVPWGKHCIYNAYKEKCCARNPFALIKALKNTQFEKKNCHRYSRIIANSSYIKNELVLSGLDQTSIQVLPYFAENVVEKDCLQADAKRILFIGRLSRTKGVHCLLDAFAEVLKVEPEAYLDVAGAGIHEQEFMSQACLLGIEDRVVFHGWSDRMAIYKLLKKCRVVAFPSIYPEAFGIVGIEAMMHARPVVAFDVGGVSDWLSDGVTGSLVLSKDVGHYARELARLLSDDEGNFQMGTAARKQAQQDFSEEGHMECLLKIYDHALSLDLSHLNDI